MEDPSRVYLYLFWIEITGVYQMYGHYGLAAEAARLHVKCYLFVHFYSGFRRAGDKNSTALRHRCMTRIRCRHSLRWVKVLYSLTTTDSSSCLQCPSTNRAVFRKWKWKFWIDMGLTKRIVHPNSIAKKLISIAILGVSDLQPHMFTHPSNVDFRSMNPGWFIWKVVLKTMRGY